MPGRQGYQVVHPRFDEAHQVWVIFLDVGTGERSFRLRMLFGLWGQSSINSETRQQLLEKEWLRSSDPYAFEGLMILEARLGGMSIPPIPVRLNNKIDPETADGILGTDFLTERYEEVILRESPPRLVLFDP